MNLNSTRSLYAGADPVRARQVFRWTFAITLLIKLWLAAYFPMTGDEAFFYQWGVFPDWGYSDHPPMVGWLLFVLNSFSDHPLSLRFFTVLMWSLIALGMVDLLRRISPYQEGAAYWLGTLFLLLPFTLLLNIVTTDTPLIFFMFLSGYCFIRGNLSGKTLWYVATGIFLGCALLSKYFAGLLAIAYFVYLCRSRRGWVNLIIIALCSAPLFAITVVFNAHNCWSNVMFNMINRNENAEWSLYTVGQYLLMMVYLITPWIFIKLLRSAGMMAQRGAIVVLFLVPFALFLLLSMEKTIGLHWVLGFMPFLFLFIGTCSSAEDLRKYAKWTAWFSVPHFLFLAAIILLPITMWKDYALHDDIVFHKEAKTIVATLRKDLPAGGVIMARAYTPAALLSYHAGEYLPTFGQGKFHARQDDLHVDFKEYAGKTIRMFDRRAINPADLAPYFSSVTVHTMQEDGVTFWYADGKDFNYEVYRERILTTVADKYYRIPSFLPVYGCGFLERYDLPRPK
ncbi:ArnT family glycosyltransferase [Herminiimonas arsenitoxidans]|uniref:ArnT family glycosyltransferase n=1 Tax=Herminiimonas arsenitoxidans TaxID=1809410 RepID=UPI00097139BC|nr:glycosyltransferase family 39 protein [Herminiimonas arsenitoxidans]